VGTQALSAAEAERPMNARFSTGSGAGFKNGGMQQTSTHRPSKFCAALALALLCGATAAADTTPAQQLQRWSNEAGAPGQAERGRVFFNSRHGSEWSCASCHGSPPVRPGKHASTGKTIEAMAPAANAQAFTDAAKSDKWFRRNCKDVLQRECSAREKADVMAYLTSLQ
jgi:hypothetical protein